MVQRYETLYIAVPEITQAESAKVENQLSSLVKDAKGAIISSERWGKYHLAYPIRKNDYGVYYLFRFEIDDEGKEKLLENIKKTFGVKFHDLIMRNIVVHLHPEGSLEYKRPESLEEVPQDIDVIMKESKAILKEAPQEEVVEESETEMEEE